MLTIRTQEIPSSLGQKIAQTFRLCLLGTVYSGPKECKKPHSFFYLASASSAVLHSQIRNYTYNWSSMLTDTVIATSL